MKTRMFATRVYSALFLLTFLAIWPGYSEPVISASSPPASIDGTYELTERVMADGTVLRPPSVVALYILWLTGSSI